MKLDLILEAFFPTGSIIMWLKWFFPPRSKWNPNDLSLLGKALFWWVELQTIGDLGLQVAPYPSLQKTMRFVTASQHGLRSEFANLQGIPIFMQHKNNYKENSRGEHLFMQLCDYILRCLLSQIFHGLTSIDCIAISFIINFNWLWSKTCNPYLRSKLCRPRSENNSSSARSHWLAWNGWNTFDGFQETRQRV